jgi:hypothetical protein
MRRFLPSALIVVLAALIAEAAGAGGTFIIVELLGVERVSTGLGANVVFAALAIPPAAIVLSLGVAGRPWSAAEAGVAFLAVVFSLWLGPMLFAIVDAVLTGLAPAAWSALSGSELRTDPFWALAILIIALPLEFYVWRTTAPARVHARYSVISILARAPDAHPRVVRRVRSEIQALRLHETTETTRVVAAIRAWGDAFAADRDALEPDLAVSLVAEVDRAMADLFGRQAGSSQRD